jgi:hypothetical protein
MATAEDCKKLAEATGNAVAYDAAAKQCWQVFGNKVTIGDQINSVQEAIEIINENFATNGTQPAVPTQDDLPGPVG